MASFSYVKALENEIADLKADLVELSGKISDDAAEAKDDAAAMMPPIDLMSAAMCAGLIGLAAGYVLGSRRA